MHIKTKKIVGYIYIYIDTGYYVLIWKLLIWCLGGAHIGTYYGLSQEVLVKNVVLLIFCKKPHMGFWHMVDVITPWIPWASVNEYIDKIKNNNDAPCQ